MNETIEDSAELETTPGRLLGSPLAVIVSHVLAPLLSLAAMGRVAWLGWTEFDTPTLVTVAILVALAGACALGSLAVALLRGRKPFPLWADAVSILLAAGFCLALLLGQDDISRTLPGWMVGSGSFLLGFAGMMAAGFSSLWRLGTTPLKIGKVPDIGGTVLGVIAVPIMTYVVVRILFQLVDEYGSDSNLTQKLVMPVIVLAAVGLFLFVFRLFGQVFAFLDKFRRYRFVVFAEAFVITTVLPFGGLALNADVQFPADFQYPAFYLMTAFTALALMLPDGKSGAWRMAIWFARWAAMPFTLYFLVVFLPFLPFAVLAMFVFGAGILILAPTLLFWRHVRTLHRSWGGMLAAHGKGSAIAAAVAGLLLAPGVIGFVVEVHRSDLQRTLAFVQKPDYDADATLPVSRRRAEAVVRRAVDFNNGREIPLISAWYVQRVYDGMYLRDDILKRLSRQILGQPLPEDEYRWDFFGDVFSRNSGRSSRRSRGGGWMVAPSTRAYLTTNAVERVAEDEAAGDITYCVRIGVDTQHEQEEFRAPVVLPAGAWVVGMRLKIGDEWAPAAIIERKAAEFVYDKITVVERRDPALLTLDSPTQGLLRIFPVTPEGRELELDIRMPKALADGDVVKIGDTAIRHAPETAEASPVYANGVLVLPEAWKRAQAAATVPIKPGRLWVAVDCSATNNVQDVDVIAEDLVRLAKEAGAARVMLVAANAERRTTELAVEGLSDALPAALLKFKGGLDAFGAVFLVVRWAERGGDVAKGEYPRIVLYGGNWTDELAGVEPAKWRLVHEAAPGLTNLVVAAPGATSNFAVPGAQPATGVFAFTAGEERRVASAEGDSLVVFTGGGALEGVAGLAQAGGTNESRWAAGAEAWRMQFEMARNPARDLRRDILEQSWRSGVLTASGAYIVVESEAQRKMLKEKQRQALSADASFDFEEDVPAPGVLMMAAAFAAVSWLRGRRGAKRQRWACVK